MNNHNMMLEWLKLIRVPGLGPIRISRLLHHFGGARALLEASDKAWEQVPGIRMPFLQKIMRLRHETASAPLQQELDRLTAMNGHMLILGDADYPTLLQEIHDPPPVLFVLGDPKHLNEKKGVAIVGARHSSHFGRQFAHRLAMDLAKNDLTTVSGLAIGIDAAAHWGALEGGGSTVAVLATGLDVNYPPSNVHLRRRIIEEGCLVTEATLGTQPAAYLFPVRNRIISGICRGVAVIEATLRSGSLVTARMALEQGREVFAVPAQAGNPGNQGSNHLLRQGAACLEDVSDILNTFSWDPRPPVIPGQPTPASAGPAPKKDSESAAVHAILQHGPVQGDELARRSCLTVANLSRILLHLELVGVVQRLPGNQFTLKR